MANADGYGVNGPEANTERTFFGEFFEGLPGSTKSVACVKRNAENLGDPLGSCILEVHWEFVHHSKETSRLHRNIK